ATVASSAYASTDGNALTSSKFEVQATAVAGATYDEGSNTLTLKGCDYYGNLAYGKCLNKVAKQATPLKVIIDGPNSFLNAKNYGYVVDYDGDVRVSGKNKANVELSNIGFVKSTGNVTLEGVTVSFSNDQNASFDSIKAIVKEYNKRSVIVDAGKKLTVKANAKVTTKGRAMAAMTYQFKTSWGTNKAGATLPCFRVSAMVNKPASLEVTQGIYEGYSGNWAYQPAKSYLLPNGCTFRDSDGSVLQINDSFATRFKVSSSTIKQTESSQPSNLVAWNSTKSHNFGEVPYGSSYKVVKICTDAFNTKKGRKVKSIGIGSSALENYALRGTKALSELTLSSSAVKKVPGSNFEPSLGKHAFADMGKESGSKLNVTVSNNDYSWNGDVAKLKKMKKAICKTMLKKGMSKNATVKLRYLNNIGGESYV
ncbi:MAG: hypothetical protein IJ087_13725, partial [Eggerthellaceae bacterium]|nr:hypothetical protein [Eggerthellaceae bacterium]